MLDPLPTCYERVCDWAPWRLHCAMVMTHYGRIGGSEDWTIEQSRVSRKLGPPPGFQFLSERLVTSSSGPNGRFDFRISDRGCLDGNLKVDTVLVSPWRSIHTFLSPLLYEELGCLDMATSSSINDMNWQPVWGPASYGMHSMDQRWCQSARNAFQDQVTLQLELINV